MNYYMQLDWSRVTIHDAPKRHVIRIAVKLMERGGPFEVWRSLDLVPRFLAVLAGSEYARSVSGEY